MLLCNMNADGLNVCVCVVPRSFWPGAYQMETLFFVPMKSISCDSAQAMSRHRCKAVIKGLWFKASYSTVIVAPAVTNYDVAPGDFVKL